MKQGIRRPFLYLMVLISLHANASPLAVEIADSLRTLGRKSFLVGDYQNALHHFLGIKNMAFFDSLDDYRTSTCNLNLLMLYGELSQYDSANYYFQKLNNHITSDNIRLKSAALINMGHFSATSGDFSLAEEYYQACLRTEPQLQPSEIEKYWPILFSNYGTLKIYQKDYAAALKMFFKGLSYFTENSVAYNLSIYSNIAVAYRYLGNFDSCFYYQEKSLKFARNQNFTAKVFLAEIYLDFAENILYFQKQDLVNEYIQKADLLLRETGFYNQEQLRLHQIRARNYALSQQYDSAIYYAHRALSLTNDESLLFSNKAIKIDPQLPFIFQIDFLKDLIGYYIAYYAESKHIEHLIKGSEIADIAMDMVDSLKTSFVTKESQLYLIGNESSIYEKAHFIASSLYQKTGKEQFLLKGFDIAERSKYAVLRTALRGSNALTAGNIPQDLRTRERSLRSTISYLKQQIYEEQAKSNHDSVILREHQAELFQNQIQYQSLIKFFEDDYPEYYRLKYDNSVRGLKATQAELPRNQTLLEYLYSDTTLYIYFLSAKAFHLIHVPIDSSFHTALNAYYDHLRNYNYLAYSDEQNNKFRQYGNILYQKLFQPAERYIKTKEIIIVPHAKLSFLPFETLPLPGAINGLGETNNYLIQRYAISYAYSSTLFARNKLGHQLKSGAEVLCFAPHYSKDFNPREYFTKRSGKAENLQNLPGAINEVQSIALLTQAKMYINEQATESTFKKVAPNFDILHFAMHTLINHESPLYSKMIFATDSDTKNDGMLNTSEIFDMQLKAKLAILSSCSSGEGEIRNGEGVLSLARGFHYAGCPSLVYTLWPIADKAGQPLMHEFYKNLLKGQNKNTALRNAKLHYINHHPAYLTHPFFWSAYVCLGDTSPIYIGTYRILTISIVIGLAVLGLIYLRYTKQRK